MSHNSDDSDWQQCDSEVAIKNRQPRATRVVNSQNQSCQTEETFGPRKHCVKSLKNSSHEVLKSVHQTSGECIADKGISMNSRGQAIRAEMKSKSDARPMRAMQSNECTNRLSMTEKNTGIL